MTDTMDNATLLRVKKLLDHSESAKELGSVEEAASFAAKAAELCSKYKLDMSDVQFAAEQEKNPVGLSPLVDLTTVCGGPNAAGFRRRSLWAEYLAQGIAQSVSCRFLITARTKAIWFVGRKSDREIAEYLLLTLAERAWHMASKYYYAARKQAEKNGTKMPKKPKESFLLGFALGVIEKLAEQRRAALQSSSKALVRLNDPAVKEYMEENYGDKEPLDDLDPEIGDFVSFGVGHLAGTRAAVQPGLKETQGKKGVVSKGQPRLR
jgi:hypothetical protein